MTLVLPAGGRNDCGALFDGMDVFFFALLCSLWNGRGVESRNQKSVLEPMVEPMVDNTFIRFFFIGRRMMMFVDAADTTPELRLHCYYYYY